MRVVVVGISGAGKTTFSRRLAAAAGIPHTDLDEINWRPGWVGRSKTDPEGFIADVAARAGESRWTIAGSYHSKVGHLLWSRATHAAWLDFSRWRVMSQVVPRSLRRVIERRDVFPGCKEDWTRLFRADHPIRFAWDNHAGRRKRYGEVSADPAYGHVAILRLRTRQATEAALQRLIAEAKG